MTEEAKEKTYQWEIEPNPYAASFEVLVTGDDKAAARAVIEAALRLFSDIKPGQERILKVRYSVMP